MLVHVFLVLLDCSCQSATEHSITKKGASSPGRLWNEEGKNRWPESRSPSLLTIGGWKRASRFKYGGTGKVAYLCRLVCLPLSLSVFFPPVDLCFCVRLCLCLGFCQFLFVRLWPSFSVCVSLCLSLSHCLFLWNSISVSVFVCLCLGFCLLFFLVCPSLIVFLCLFLFDCLCLIILLVHLYMTIEYWPMSSLTAFACLSALFPPSSLSPPPADPVLSFILLFVRVRVILLFIS